MENRIAVRLEGELYEKVLKWCESSGMTLSEAVRQSLRLFTEKEPITLPALYTMLKEMDVNYRKSFSDICDAVKEILKIQEMLAKEAIRVRFVVEVLLCDALKRAGFSNDRLKAMGLDEETLMKNAQKIFGQI